MYREAKGNTMQMTERWIQQLLDLAKLPMIEALGSDETAVGGFVAAEQIDSQPTVY